MSDENKVITPEEAKDQKLVSGSKGKPLVDGHRDEKVILPLAALQEKQEKQEKQIQQAYTNMFEMMRMYGPATQLSKQNSASIKYLDIAYSALVEVLQNRDIFTTEELEKVTAKIEDTKALEFDEEDDKRNNREVVDKTTEKDDIICFDFKGKIDGEYFEGGEAKRFNLLLGSNQFIPGFEDQLMGLKAGDEKIVKVTFPEDYRMKQFAGKSAEFEVKVHAVKRRKPMEVKDETQNDNQKTPTEEVTKENK